MLAKNIVKNRFRPMSINNLETASEKPQNAVSTISLKQILGFIDKF